VNIVNNFMKNALLLFFVVTLASCASVGTNFDSRKITDIQKGKTTEPQLVAMFGKPNSRGVNSENGSTLMWIYSEAQVKGSTFIPLAGAFVGGATSKTKTLTVRLDQSGTVSGYDYTGGGFESTGMTQTDPENATNAVAKSPRSK
jgi:hypothetical protein